MWDVKIIAGDQEYLTFAVNKLQAEGWELKHALPNGVDRWTLFFFKAQG